MLDHIGYDLIIDEIPRYAKVLDLGCGDGELLVRLKKLKQANAFGVEISEDGVSQCVEKGLYCYQGDIDEGLSDYRDKSFDYVILNQTLQDTKRPDYVLQEILRISKNAIISFPNYGYYISRLQLLFLGKAPQSTLSPHPWYESRTFHNLTIRDFEEYCQQHNSPIRRTYHFNISKSGESIPVRWRPNLLARFGFFILSGD